LAITGADGRGIGRIGLALLLAVSSSCVSGSVPVRRPTEAPTPAPVPSHRDPEIRVGLVVGSNMASIGGSDALVVNEPDGSRVAIIPAGQTWQASSAGSAVTLTSPTGWISPPLDRVTLAAADPTAPVRVNGKVYRGLAEILPGQGGLTVVNRVGVEAYLQGVVSAEMGRRNSIEEAALRAQAVVSRTYALRYLGRWRAKGFDVTGTVSDQVYGGLAVETSEGRAAVADTRGRVLTYNGALIEAFFFSTCGGRTADGTEVFRGAAQPYLRSVADRAENGFVYCSISPRYRWHEEWTSEALLATLQRNLPPIAGVRSEQVGRVTDVRVVRRTGSGRVDQLGIGLGGPEIRVDGAAIRQVLRPPSGELLRSNAFNLIATGGGRMVTHLTVEGMGSGHGVGFCQWGAVGRARAGQGFEQILAAYFPGTRLERRY
jgi:stage II sporulation protein D (peptidoglycan lytic transglycosylase)